MRASRLAVRVAGAAVLLVLLASGTGATCEQQDFAEVGEVLEVSASQDRPADTLAEPIEHDVITRHAVDYNVTSGSDTDQVEVVVEATSSVNGIERATGRAVLRLPAGESVHGRIPDLQLEVGDQLDLSLQCCQASQCNAFELLCPEALAEGETAADPLVCLEGCDRLDECDADCAVDPTRAECETNCADGDADCLASCATVCRASCQSRTVACAANCLAYYRRCLDLPVPTTTGLVPCSLCGESETALCDPATLTCAPGQVPSWPRQRYPLQCMTVCTDDAVFDPADTAGRFDCLESCVLTHQRANNLDPNGVDDDLDVTSPCCYAQTCEARMSAVVKLDAVECFDDADCGSERECNERLICVNRLREEQSGCQVVGPRRGGDAPAWPWLLAALGLLGWVVRRPPCRLAATSVENAPLSGVQPALADARFPRPTPGALGPVWGGGVGTSQSTHPLPQTGGGARRSRAEGAAARLTMLFVLLVALLWPVSVEAEPARFRRTRSTFSVGLTSGTFLVGAVGGATGAGLGLSAQQTLSSGYWGGSVRIGASVYTTERGELVFDQGIQTYYVAAGPRLVIPTFDETELYVYVQPEYMLEGIQSNALVELTGSVAPFVHGPGGVVGTSLVFEPLALDLGVGFTWLFPVQTGQLTVTLGAGFSGIL